MPVQARLISWTPRPLELIWFAYHHEKHGVAYPEELASGEATISDAEKDEALELLLEGWCPALELPTTTWSFRVPKAFHAQLRVHRHWTCWSESHQLVEPDEFAHLKDYFELPQPDPAAFAIYEGAMLEAEANYKHLRSQGILPSVARLVLPQAINLGLTAGINMRALRDLAILRSCHIFQGVWWVPLLAAMKDEVTRKIDPALGRLFELQPCDVTGRCLSNIEQLQRVNRRDPHRPCPRFVHRRGVVPCQKCKGMARSGAMECEGCIHGDHPERSPRR